MLDRLWGQHVALLGAMDAAAGDGGKGDGGDGEAESGWDVGRWGWGGGALHGSCGVAANRDSFFVRRLTTT